MTRSWLERLYLAIHYWLYRRRQARATRIAGARVISIGNLSAGGSGKTPLVIALAAELERRKIPAAVALRGYGGSASAAGALVSDGETIRLGAAEAGDEALLIARRTRARVFVGRDRVRAVQSFAGDARCILLDDAFQNPSLARDHEVVLIDASLPLAALRVFPAGKFREGLEALLRADTILLTRVDQAPPEQLAQWQDAIRSSGARAPVFQCVHRPGAIRPAPPAGVRLGAFCGIGNPDAFFRTLERAGYAPAVRRSFPDHYNFRPGELRELLAQADCWITTEKDHARLSDCGLSAAEEARLFTLPIELEIQAGRSGEFFSRLLDGPAASADSGARAAVR